MRHSAMFLAGINFGVASMCFSRAYSKNPDLSDEMREFSKRLGYLNICLSVALLVLSQIDRGGRRRYAAPDFPPDDDGDIDPGGPLGGVDDHETVKAPIFEREVADKIRERTE